MNVVKIAFNDGIMPRNLFASHRYSATIPEQAFLTEEEIRQLQTVALQKMNQDFVLTCFSCFTGISNRDMQCLSCAQVKQDHKSN